jgi:hypothetical protein
MVNSLGFLLGLFLSGAVPTQAEPPTPDSLVQAIKAGGEQRQKALAEVRGLFTAEKDKQKLLKELSAVLDAVAEIPLQKPDSQALNSACQLFAENKVQSAAAVAFARNLVAREPSEQNVRYWDAAIRLMVLNGIKDEAFKRTLVQHLRSLPVYLLPDVFRYFGEHYCDDPSVTEAAASLLADADTTTADHALRHFGLLKLDRKSASKVADRGVQALESGNLRLAWDYLRVCTARPGAYSGLLGEPQTSKLAGILKQGEEEPAQVALMILAAAGNPGSGLIPMVLERFGKASGRDARLLMILGFLPTGPMSDAQRRTILDAIQTAEIARNQEALAGLVSVYLRSSQAPGKTVGELAAVLPQYVPLDQWPYWRALRGPVCKTLIPPSQWKTNWNFLKDGKAPSPQVVEAVRTPILQSLPCHPDSPETQWVLEQAVGENVRPDLVLLALESVAERKKEVVRQTAFENWLRKVAGEDPKLENRCRAARLLADGWQKTTDAVSFVEAAYAVSPEKHALWTVGTEVLLCHQADGKAIEKLRTALRSNEKVRGGEFLVWIVDVRTGKRPGPPPAESLPDALARPDAMDWIGGLKAAGKQLDSQHLATLRHPGLVLAGSAQTALQAYLGALDAVEISLKVGAR